MLKGISEQDILVHDRYSQEPGVAQHLSRMSFPEEPYALGIFRQVVSQESDVPEHAGSSKTDVDDMPLARV